MKRYAFREPTADTPSTYPTPEMKELFVAILSLKNPQEATHFFRDLLTMAEIKEFANRWQMVKMLVKGKSYMEIADALRVSTTTVTRVAHWLHHGMGGYKTIAGRVFKIHRKDSDKSKSHRMSG